MRAMTFLAAATLPFVAQLAGAAMLESVHRDGLIDKCVTAYRTMPPPPAAVAAEIPALKYRGDPAKLHDFCACHADMSFAPVPQADYDQYLIEIRRGAQGPAFAKVQPVLASQAPKVDMMCDAKLGGGK